MISIVIPTYNRNTMLIEAIQSIQKQSYQEIEIIIVDDCSTDNTEEIIKREVKDSRIRYFRNLKNMGPGYNRGFGVQQAHGEYIIFMDDDDYYIKNDFFEKAVTLFEDNSDKKLALVAANAWELNVNTGEKKEGNIGCIGLISGIEYMLNIGNQYEKPKSTFTSIFSTRILRESRIEESKMVNDIAIYMRALLYGNAYIVEDKIGIYRVHGENISFNLSAQFILGNLEERVWAKNVLLDQVSKKIVEIWWQQQMIIIYKYYLVGSRPKLEDAFLIMKYILGNSKFNLGFLMKILLYTVGYKVHNHMKN